MSDAIAAGLRAAITILVGSALLYAAGRYLGWWIPLLIVAVGAADYVWCERQVRS